MDTTDTSQFDPKAFLAQGQHQPQPTQEEVPVDETQLRQFDPKDFVNQLDIAKSAELQSQYGTTPQSILAGIEAVARGGSLGTSDWLESKTGLSTPEAIKGRMAANPSISFLGNITGGTAAAIGTGGFGLAKAGVSGIARLATEGGIFGLGNVISDAALGDPNLNAQKILTQVGSGVLLGGGLGLIGKSLKAIPALLRGGTEEAAGVKAVSPEQALKDVGLGNEVPITKAEEGSKFGAPNGGDLRESFPIDALSEADQKPVVDGLNNLKPNAGEILEAGQKLGAPIPEGMLVADEHVQKIDHALTQSPSPQGVARNSLYNASYKAATDSVSNALGETGTLSLAEAGNQAKNLLTQSVEGKYAPIKDLYSKIAEIAPEIPIENPYSASKAILKIIPDHGLVDGTPEYNYVKVFAKGLGKIKNINELKNFRTALRNAKDKQTQYTYGRILNVLDGLEADSIESYIPTIKGPSEAQANALLGQLRQARAAYAPFREEINKVGKLLWGKRRIYGPEDFLNEIEDETPEKFATRLFDKNNSNALAWMGDKFPEVLNHLSEFEKSKIRQASLTKGDFSATKFLKNLSKMSPEVKDIMFTPEEHGVFKAGQVYFDNVLPNFNPSGTAGALQYHEFLKHPVSSTLNWVKDFGVTKLIKHAANLTPEQVEAAQLDADKWVKLKGIYGMLDRVGKQIAQGAQDALQSHGTKSAILKTGTYLSGQEYDKIVNDINNLYSNPETMMNDMADNSKHLYDAAPNITQGIHTTQAQAVAFLASKIPKQPLGLPLSPSWKPSVGQRGEFNQYYQGVSKPLDALKHIKTGTLSTKTMEALQAVHPQLLEDMRSNVLQHMNIEKVKKLPYSQKVSLSKFLGQPLSVNMMPQAIQSNQAALSVSQAQEQQKKAAQMGLGKVTAKGLQSLDLSQSAMTPSQRARAGEE